MGRLLRESLEAAPVVDLNGYSYFVHPLTDGIPQIDAALLDEVVEEILELVDMRTVDRIVTVEAMGIPVATALSPRDTPSQPPASQSGPPPPYRGAPLAPQAPAAPSLAPDAAPHETAEQLIAQTDGAAAPAPAAPPGGGYYPPAAPYPYPPPGYYPPSATIQIPIPLPGGGGLRGPGEQGGRRGGSEPAPRQR